MDLKEYFHVRIDTVNQALADLLPCEEQEPQQLHQAMRYSVFAGGKRLRPILFIATCEALGQDWLPILPYACALEMIHTYSLIHDDLPCMDNDDLRRGRPTCHKVYGEATALLAGDALLTHAFTIFAKVKAKPEHVIGAMGLLGEAAGCAGMVGGQKLDLENEGKKISAELMQRIHAKKTGALFSASIVGAAKLSGAEHEHLHALRNFAENIGIAFQIVDDILDVVGDEAVLGKPVGSDIKNEKATYPALFGLENARKMAEERVTVAIEEIAKFGEKAAALREIALYVLNRDH